MFTGLVAGTGRLKARVERGPGYRMAIDTRGLAGFEQLELGESIAVGGVCLTVETKLSDGFETDVSVETAEKTTLGRLPLEAELNLERSLKVGDHLGGHWVSGHVDGLARVAGIAEQGDAWLVRVAFAEEHARFLAQKGSVALDGVSLTVNAVQGHELEVMLIPHTRQVTALKHWRPGSELNIEVDLVARYLVRYFEATGQKPPVDHPLRFGLAPGRDGYK